VIGDGGSAEYWVRRNMGKPEAGERKRETRIERREKRTTEGAREPRCYVLRVRMQGRLFSHSAIWLFSDFDL